VKRFLALISSSTLVCAMSVAPVLADTGTTSTSTDTSVQHTLDCLALLFTDPAKHAQECGGPGFTPAPSPTSGGDGACLTGEIVPFDSLGEPVKSDGATLVATGIYCGCITELTGPQQQLAPMFDTLWSTDRTWLVTATACR